MIQEHNVGATFDRSNSSQSKISREQARIQGAGAPPAKYKRGEKGKVKERKGKERKEKKRGHKYNS